MHDHIRLKSEHIITTLNIQKIIFAKKKRHISVKYIYLQKLPVQMRPKDTTPNIREYCDALRKRKSFRYQIYRAWELT